MLLRRLFNLNWDEIKIRLSIQTYSVMVAKVASLIFNINFTGLKHSNLSSQTSYWFELSRKLWTCSFMVVALSSILSSANSTFDTSLTTLQCLMNTKFSPHRFWPCHENELIKTIQTIPHNLYVSFKLSSLYCGLRLILVYPNPQ